MRFSIAPNRRHWLAGTTLLVAALTYPTSGNALTICRDGDELTRGVPERFNYVSVDGVTHDYHNIGSLYDTQITSYTPFDYSTGHEFFDESIEDEALGSVADLDVMLKFKHPRINETMVWLRHTIYAEAGPPDVLTIPLTAFDGCNVGDYDQRTEFNQDMAVYFDDDAVANVQFACERSIPTVQGRLSPSTASISDGDPATNETITLEAFNGRVIFGTSVWEILVFDDSGLGETGALVEWCLIFNTREEGDVAPREETATVSVTQSGNGILTISDHVDTALVLLDYLDIDHRLIEKESIDLSEHEGEEAPDVSGSDPATQLPVQIAINEDQFENLRRSSGLEYTVMDTAPASSSGDGLITVADWVQTTRYSSGEGFDTPKGTNGALAPSDRLVWAGNTTIPRGLTQEIPIYMRSKNVEHEVAFGLQFDPEQLELQNVEAGPCIPDNATFELKNQENANEDGIVGLQVGLLPDQTFLCNDRVRPGLIENGDDKIDAEFDNDETKPTSVPFILEAYIWGENEIAQAERIAPNPTRITTESSHVYKNGDQVEITGIIEAAGIYTVTVINNNEFYLDGTAGGYDFSVLGVGQVQSTEDPFNFDDPDKPVVTVGFFLSNESETIVNDYNFNIIYDHYRLKLPDNYRDIYDGQTMSAPKLTDLGLVSGSPNLKIMNVSFISETPSSFYSGTLFTIDFDIINTWLDIDGGIATRPADASSVYSGYPKLYLDKSDITTVNAEIVGNNSALTYTQYVSTDVNPIKNPIEISIVDDAGNDTSNICPVSDTMQLNIKVDKNIQPVTSFQFQLAQSTASDIDVETPLTPSSINEYYNTNKLTIINSSTFANITGYNAKATYRHEGETIDRIFMNGFLVNLETTKSTSEGNFVSAPITDLYSGSVTDNPKLTISSRNAFFFKCGSPKSQLNTLINIAKSLDETFNPKQPPVEPQVEEKAAKDSPATLASKLIKSEKDDSGDIIITVGVDLENLPEEITDVTDYHFMMTYEPGTLELLTVEGENGFAASVFGRLAECADLAGNADLPYDVFGLPFDEECKAPWGDPTTVPVNSRANFDTWLIEGEKAAGAFTSGRLATLTYKVVGKTTTAPSIIFTELAPIAQPVKIASMYFKALPGEGAQVTNLDFVADPMSFIAPTVRNVAGAPIYSSFASAGVTVIDNADSRPTVRVVDTVLASATPGTVQIALDSVGVENAIGFKLKYDPSQIILNTVSPGRHIPTDGFFFTYPSQNDILSANDTGELSILVSNQPGAAFEAGRRILANLNVIPIATTDPVDAIIEFYPLYDAAEVVDPFGIPIVARFPEGNINIAGQDCIYSISDGDDDPLYQSYDITGGTGSFDITVSSGCPWTVVTNADWINLISSEFGTGNGTVFFSIDQNVGLPREGTIEVAGNTYNIDQSGCTFYLSETVETFCNEGGASSFGVVAANAACEWIAQSDNSWIVLTNAGFDTGSGTVEFAVEGSSTSGRVGSITVTMAGITKSFEVRQPQCQFNLTPSFIEDVSAEGGNYELVLTTSPEAVDGEPDSAKVPWTVGTSDDWLKFDNTYSEQQRGDAVIPFTVKPNIADNRAGTISVGDQVTTVTQVGITDCFYVITPERLDFPSTGSSQGQFSVDTEEGCPWQITLEPGVDWITIENSPTTDIGPVTVYYTVSDNEGSKRESKITVGKSEHTVFQFAEDEYAYEFRSDEQGWTTPDDPVGDFTQPNAGWGEGTNALPGNLFLEALDNTNTYGFWQSPLLEPSDYEGPTTPTLYQVDYLITSDVLTENAPTYRMRQSTKNFALSTVQVATSNGNGSFSPGPDGKEYRQYFELLPQEVDRFHSFFEILSFDPNQAVAPATLRLENISIIPIKPYTDFISDQQSEALYILANETTAADWNAVPSGATVDPEFIRSERGLEIGAGVATGSSEIAVVGFWTHDSDITLVEDRLYEVKFKVAARTKNGLPVRKELVPTFRLRLNDSTFKSSAYLNVDSRYENDRYGNQLDPVVPTFSQSEEYTVWFQAPAELNGEKMLMAFDLIYTMGDDPETNLILEQVEVNSYQYEETAE